MRLIFSSLFLMAAAVFLSSIPLLRGQIIRVASSPAAPGGDTRVMIWLDSGPANTVVGLQIEIELPSRVLSINGSAEAGEAANSAGKMASCNDHWKKTPQSYTMKCIVVGGRSPIPHGALLVLKGKVDPKAKPGKHPIKVTHVLAVDVGAKSIPMKSAESVFTVNSK
jgi:hypothetical protein